MDVFEAIRNRRSVRKYRREPISDETLTELISAATWAPYGTGEEYPLRFVAIRDRDRLEAVRDLTGDPVWHAFVADAGAVVAVVRDTSIAGGDADAHAATQNLLLAAHARGLGTCWIESFHRGRISALMDLPDTARAVCLVTVGVAAEEPVAPPRPDTESVMVHEDWRGAWTKGALCPTPPA